MDYELPTNVHAEPHAVWNHREELAALGRKALIVTGRNSSRRNGSLEDVKNALQDQKIFWTVFDGIEENPSIETVRKGAELGLAQKCDFVIGVGGGSPMDGAKAIAWLMGQVHNSVPMDEALIGLYDPEADDSALPVAAVPTTCGTGSEVTGVSVLTLHAKKTKKSISHKIYPALALVDGSYLAYAPMSVLQDTAMDALAHLYESYLNTRAGEDSRMVVLCGLKVWALSLPVFLGDKKPEAEDYQNMICASTLAGMAIARTGTSIPHALSYRVTYDLGMKHGKACMQFLPGYLALASEADRKFLLENAGFRDMDHFMACMDQVEAFEALPAEVREKILEDVGNRPERLALAPYPVDRERLEWMVDYPKNRSVPPL